jgi:hypothetical protein
MEFPVVLGLFLLLVFFPLLDLGVLFLGSSSVSSAARIATVDAGKAPSFITDTVTTTGTPPNTTSTTHLSAFHIAQKVAAAAATNGVAIDPIASGSVVLLEVPIVPNDQGAQPATVYRSPPTKIDTVNNTYQVQVTVTGHVSPLVTLGSNIFGVVPGLTAPLTVTQTSTSTVEGPTGWTQ